MWLTLFIIVLCLIGIPIGILVLVTAILILMPIHIGASGYYHDETYAVEGWAKLFAGLIGVVFEYNDLGGQLQVVVGKWVVWQPKEDANEELDKKTPDSSPLDRAEPVRISKDDSDTQSTPTEIQRDVPFDSVPSDVETSVTSPTPPIRPIETSDALREDTSVQAKANSPVLPPTKSPEEGGKPSWWTRFRALRVQFYRYLDYWQTARPVLFRFLKRLMRILSFRYIDIQVVFGASDPAQTGRLYGYAQAVRPFLGKRTKLVLTPDFTQSRIEGVGAVELSFYLSRLLWAVLALGVRGGLLGAKIWWRERQVKRSVVLNEA